MSRDNTNLKRKLKLFRSDLADAKNPKILAKYPHLGYQEIIDGLEATIKDIEKRLNED